MNTFKLKPVRKSNLCGIRTFFTLAFLSGIGAGLQGAGERRLLFDDYYQKERPEELFVQGVARGGSDLRDLTNFYSPEATAIPNGTFAFSQLVGDKYAVELSRRPLTAEMLRKVEVYMLVCPVREEYGGRSNLGEREADLLAAFVARGGSLVLVANSVPDPTRSGLDLAGLNIIARRFGVEFQAAQTETMSIPIAHDHALFDGVPSMIFGNGTTLAILPSADAATQVILESHNEAVPGPVAVLCPFGEGKVLLFGDAGTFGNAHVFRGDIGQAAGLRQMMFGLLPDGPAPRYGWKEGLRIRAKLKQEQILSGYPEFLRLFELPRPAGSVLFTSGMRQIDREAGDDRPDVFASRDFASAVSTKEADLLLEIGPSDSRAFHATWRQAGGNMEARLLPTGRFVSRGLPEGEDLIAWQRILTSELFCAPLKAYALPGEKWIAGTTASLPQFQLTMAPHLVEASSTFTFEGESEYLGRACHLFRRTTWLDAKNWSAADLVDSRYSAQFNSGEIEIQTGGQLEVAKYWISKDTLLPVHVEIRASAALWWKDARFPAKYIGHHDSKNYEEWANINLNATYGRVLTADFVVVDEGPPGPSE